MQGCSLLIAEGGCGGSGEDGDGSVDVVLGEGVVEAAGAMGVYTPWNVEQQTMQVTRSSALKI